MDFGYENEVLFPFSFDVAEIRQAGPGRTGRKGLLARLPRGVHSRQGRAWHARACWPRAPPAVTHVIRG